MSFQVYLNELKQQLDLLYSIVEQMQRGLRPDDSHGERDLSLIASSINPEVFSLDLWIGGESCEDQHILFDEGFGLEGHPTGGQHMSPELQITRLTAQLTVAYKRIAQLEEQLLSRHNEHHGNKHLYSR